MIKKLLRHLSKKVLAHCDIPCGIYEPTIAKIAAKSALRMIKQLNQLPLIENWHNKQEVLIYLNETARRIQVKEQQAEIVKNELRILWGDFFKEEHLQKYPQLHELFFKAMKKASKVKQTIDENEAIELCQLIDQIAQIFYEVKGVPERYHAYLEITENLFS